MRIAGAVVSGAEALLWQNRVMLSAAGMSSETVDAYCGLLGEAFEARITGTMMPSAEGRNIPDALKQNYQAVILQLQSPYMKYFLTMDMRPLLGRITCPVLALNGSLDQQVEAEGNLGALRSGLPGNPHSRIETVEGLNHLFQHCRTGAAAEYKEIEETFAPEVLEMMVKWIDAVTL